jgi:Flp pilus assembly protein TadG
MIRLSNLRGQARSLLHGFCRAKAACGASVKARSIGGRSGALLCFDVEGQSLVEFALVLPMLLMVVTFMFSISMAMISYEQLNVATANAALLQLAPARNFLPDPCSSIQTAVTYALPGFTASNLTYTVTIQNSSGTNVTYGPTTGTGFSCTPAFGVLSADQPGTPASLKVSYTYSWLPVYLQHMTGNLSVTQPVTVY